MNYANHDHYLICELSKDLPVYEIAEKFELSQYAVKKILLSYGIEPAAKKRKTKADKIYDLILDGKSNEEIADLMDCDTSHVRQVKMLRGMKSSRKQPDVKLYKKQCADVDHLRSHGMTTVDACKNVGITKGKYQVYRDDIRQKEEKSKRLRGVSQTKKPLQQVNKNELQCSV